ncbi:restriction endonuclease [Phormidium sp. CCY1219]|uniref:restriction endonuclease n=1 Tax=Phormidium sp. CCY1219 TaxID=2886104 RepID=UPI002D1F0F04|nr:restriction endonuclease [Phormidium sp. CCY1219]MEB3829790.1 restriction endonuclease [Phormidium sp. CCY1219]
MSRDRAINALIKGIVAADTATKQELGRRFAFGLGLIPGSPGADGGIDGSGRWNDLNIYFQSKLNSRNLRAEYADSFYAKLVRFKADIGLMLAGVGYTGSNRPLAGFRNRLLEFPDVDRYKIHLLSLRDIFAENQAFEETVRDLPPLRQLTREVWEDLS